MNNIWLCESQGKYDKAKHFYLQAIELREKLLGNEHSDMATGITYLTDVYLSQGMTDKAKPLLVICYLFSKP
ncbi:MAG: tetratricopeptide repeat protein [Symploca sp. SIO2E6]|nr:tetratricopeptide repeat protein [Symploca sp. SIO2E6]